MNSGFVMASVIGIGLTGAAIAVLLRQYRPEFAMLVTLAAALLILLTTVQWVLPVLEQVRSLLDCIPEMSEYAAVLLKAVGICFITQLACGLCRDAGESAIASHVETAGKIAILLTCLPMFGQILNLVLALLEI